MEKTVCELFAGVGGFRLGLEKTNTDWQTVWFSQWEPNKTKQWAHACYVSHWGNINNQTNMDISKVDKHTIPDHNLLVGGFPCQNYSVAASKSSKGIEGEKGVLWWQIRDTLIVKRPAFVLLENVDRLLKSPASQRGRDFGIMLTCFAQLGYSVEWRVINAADYGAAQRRRRIFIYAYLNNTHYAQRQNNILAEKIIEKEGFFANTFPLNKIEALKTIDFYVTNLTDTPCDDILYHRDLTTYMADLDLLHTSENFMFAFENSGYMNNGHITTCKVTPIIETATNISEILETNVDHKYELEGETLEKWKYLKGAKRINRTSKTGHEYVFSEGAIAFPDPIDKPSRTMLTSESSLNRSTHVIQDPITKHLRLITPIEAERLQGFDDDWTNTGMPEKFRYFCMGNALVVPMITRMCLTLNEIFENEP